MKISSAGRSRWHRARKSAADVLVNLAYRLDDERPTVVTGPGDQYTISIGGLRLAKITPGMIRDTRDFG